MEHISVIGGGLAGSEAAWQIAQAGIKVRLYEMRPVKMTDVHKTVGLAELVCSNSFRSDDHEQNAVGLLHEEMRRLDGLIIKMADQTRLPAGGALAVDRDGFSQKVEEALREHPLVELFRDEIKCLPDASRGRFIIATGPLTSPDLAKDIAQANGRDHLAFFDAIAPIVYRESVNMDKAWFQSRYDKPGPGGTGKDYLNCALDQQQYETFIDALLQAECMDFRDFEKSTPYFEGCLPVEVMAERGRETLRFGPMKPVGLMDPSTGKQPYAVVQLRQDNALGTLFNLVGFQTKMRYQEQVRILRLIPALEHAEFARLGGIHRNTFINSPTLLDGELRLKSHPHLRFAGQITGCEGYVESAATGLLAGLFAAHEIQGKVLKPPPVETAHGALLNHIVHGSNPTTFQPMNINFGLFPPLNQKFKKQDRKRALTRRALDAIEDWPATDKRLASVKPQPLTVT